ncbi:MAG: 16S rRNA (cytidine(1402)-2'-O)-methyltransferase [Candidatus Nealsonbacteria bacterium]
MGILYIVATPIGNLEDISQRALRILSAVDLILCEDTRVTQKLLNHYGIRIRTISYHQHTEIKRTEEIVRLLRDGKNLALVSDAGTPGISDPGNRLIEQLNVCFPGQLTIVPVPGPSALSAAASIAGFPMDRFVFLGFPPVKKKRKKFFEEAVNSDYPAVFYESPYRILKTLQEIDSLTPKKIVVCRELTKKFETVYRGSAKEVLAKLTKDEVRGEFVVVLGNK